METIGHNTHLHGASPPLSGRDRPYTSGQTIKHNIQEALHGLDQLIENPAVQGQTAVAAARETLKRLSDRLGYDIKDNGVAEVIGELRQATGAIIQTLKRSPELRRGHAALLRSLKKLQRDTHQLTWSLEIPARRLAGVLPVKRLIPQDVHSRVDYGHTVAVGLSGVLSGDPRAQIGGLALALTRGTLAALTDYRLSLRKLIPIEVHEVSDYAWGLMAISAPFVLGYHKKAPRAAMVHIGLGVATILGSLFTDYRAARGVGRVRTA